jgi:cell division transport system permease protein
MAQFGKASGKKGKPSYIYAIIGVSLVLFLFGMFGWFFLNLRKTGNYFKESIQVHAYLNRDASKKRIDSLTKSISALPYANRVEYVDKVRAMEIWNKDQDSSWKEILDNSPLPESVDFYVRADYVEKDSLNNLTLNLENAYPGVIQSVDYPKALVLKVSKWVKTAAIVILLAAVLLGILVVFSIDNTIRLAMYSNRFLIKTMQMVGATRWFIARPINQRAVLNGLIASGIAIFFIWVTILLGERYVPFLGMLHDNNGLLFLFGITVILGISITLLSTHRAVIKYLKMKLDDLY